jgi:leader peptidase (prepilin peptidase)/N-methyltransferase
VTPLAIGLAIAGFAWGLVSDRIGARWPAHEDGSVRPPGWRTAIPPLFGAVALGLLPGRTDDPATMLLFGGYLAFLTLMLATDLDQRLLPDELTYPLVPFVVVGAILGANPFVALDGSFLEAVAAAVIFPLGLYLFSIPFGSGAIGLGDLKLLVSAGLLLGLYRSFVGLVVGAFASGVVILVLMVLGRIGRKTFIPFGPFLILGIAWAILAAP